VNPISVYVHIPFCTIKCGYCDFNAYAGMDALKDAYGRALVDELREHAPLLADRAIRSVGFGGGTPGEVPANHIARVLEVLRQMAEWEPGAEVTLEVNPGTTDGSAMRELRAAGVNRLSIGAQSFHTDELRFLDRIHSAEANAAAVGLAREAGFERISLDLIYALPGQTMDSWEQSLRAAVDTRVGHISTYALTVEEGTPLARRVAAGEITPLDEDSVAAMYDRTTDLLEAAGFRQYELSNWARPGEDSRHNRVYWTDGEYLAIGAGAHGYVGGERYENIAHPREYIRAVAEHSGSVRPAMLSAYTPDEATGIADWVSLRLRLLDGFAPEEFSRRFGRDAEHAIGPVLRDCAAAGVLENGRVIRLTRAGRLLHGEVSARLVAHLTAN
jgi:oxygen-independent coproporphyrinogen III oxidase